MRHPLSTKTKPVLDCTHWVDKVALGRETAKFKAAFAKNPDKARLSEAWGLMAMDIVHNTLTCKQFRRADPEMKEEMRSAAYVALVKAARRWDPGKTGHDGSPEERGGSCISYFMAVAYWACFTALNKCLDDTHDKIGYIAAELRERGVSDAMIDYLIYGVRGGTCERLNAEDADEEA